MKTQPNYEITPYTVKGITDWTFSAKWEEGKKEPVDVALVAPDASPGGMWLNVAEVRNGRSRVLEKRLLVELLVTLALKNKPKKAPRKKQ